MGFEQLAFSFAHLGLLIYIHCQPNGLGVFGFGQSMDVCIIACYYTDVHGQSHRSDMALASARASAQLQLWW